MSQATLDLILRKITDMDRRFDSMDGRLDSLDGRFDLLAITVAGMNERLETSATKKDLREMEDRILISIDGFGKRVDAFDIELDALRGGQQRHEERLNRLEKLA
ncbi:hypothetical protein A2856_00955 [Candidatus Uhrbacteria bacterium RIFCSPHIGHO2_01_FULL_63_20]|uniref:t-SNARE coiled-coil homology domain-containing protein n=1 Tax=Candidatus Uhrbacteria bacterium RIFCSPHIGHO2_01_FULL_63_20 TaxID=1802385 RepID=A0A1F7TM34_9BACT|nr:MAG: hypothetical protein A2856_00955 [Candidatus Uhrbacteria bacterium RIFCSPHIGHO2_01_FULL_63_20]